MAADRTPSTADFGVVRLVQLQPRGLLVDRSEDGGPKRFYDVSRRIVVDRLDITPRGIEATLPNGEHVLDVHHLDHPGKAYDDDDLVCIGFSGHYEAMRGEFGSAMVDGVAGENIVVEFPDEVWPEDVGDGLTIENQTTGEEARLQLTRFASPCVGFSRFCAEQALPPGEEVSNARLAESLRFLDRGRRGFLFLLDPERDRVTVRPGDRVLLAGGLSRSDAP